MIKKHILVVILALIMIGLSGCSKPVPSEDDNFRFGAAIRGNILSEIEDRFAKYGEAAFNNFDILGKQFNPLEEAGIANSLNVVKYLLDKGADPNLISPRFNAPIIFSLVSNERTDVVSIFLNYNVNVDIIDKSGRNLLGTATATGNFNMVKILLSKVKNINIKDGLDGNSLFGAVMSKSLDICDLLIKNGININQYDRHGNTPLLLAIGMEQKEIAERLIEAGADISIINEKGFDAKKLAEHMNVKIKGLWPN